MKTLNLLRTVLVSSVLLVDTAISLTYRDYKDIHKNLDHIMLENNISQDTIDFFNINLGRSASSFVNTLRFGVIKSIKDNHATEEGIDALTRLVRELFPSYAGTELSVTRADHCIANQISKNPQRMAIFMYMAYKILYDNGGDIKSEDLAKYLLNAYHDAHFRTKQWKSIDSKRDKITLEKKTIMLFDSIKEYKITKFDVDTIYGKQSIEKVLNYFVTSHLNNRNGLKIYLNTLANLIKKKIEINQINLNDLNGDIITDLTLSPSGWNDEELKAVNISGPNDFEDKILAIASSAKTPLPYTSVKLVSNGTAKKFNRNQGISLKTSFSDCTETVLRHIFNLMLYNPKTEAWDLNQIKDQNLKEYYEKYSPKEADSNSTYQRSDWNRVVADLNTSNKAAGNMSVSYIKNNNEIKAFWENIILVIGYVTGDIPEANKLWNNNFSLREKYIKDYLINVFREFGNKNIRIDGELQKGYYYNLLVSRGSLQFIDFDEAWSIIFTLSDGHASSSDLNISDKPVIQEAKEYINGYPVLSTLFHLKQYIGDSNTFKLLNDKINELSTPLDKVLQVGYPRNNDNILDLLSIINEHYNEYQNYESIQNITTNLKGDMNWSDNYIVDQFFKTRWNSVFFIKELTSVLGNIQTLASNDEKRLSLLSIINEHYNEYQKYHEVQTLAINLLQKIDWSDNNVMKMFFKINWNDNFLSIILDQILENIQDLNQLNLSYSKLTGKNIDILAIFMEKMQNLQKLNLSDSGIDKEKASYIASKLKKHLNLKYLNISNNSITAEEVNKIVAHFPNLTSLHISNIPIGNKGIEEIVSNCPNLTVLSLYKTFIDNEGVSEIAKLLPNLTNLNIGNTNVNYQVVFEIAKHLPNLTSLNMAKNKIGGLGAIEIAKYLPNLTSLNMTNNKIGDLGAIEIANKLTQLTNLNLNFCGINSQGAIEIANKLHHLEKLNLNANNIRSEGAIEIANNLKKLQWLNLSTNNIDQTIKTHINKFHNLKFLNIQTNDLFSEDDSDDECEASFYRDILPKTEILI
ncbi:leucine-rich repeat domain-containing protein [Francisella sp. TX07-6608]|uniref:leucine-rich repeat domain-containing protein n=1 Tax=Francisella sp. TX07-6608 TaxID=573568 RepID=UPI0008F9AD01|nr:leucine-rich repeat domain-containing protein [Francisella sp. TX07-6608]OIN82898.1 leucine rich repeat family protein [Francisella sp. TX07-6608]